MQIISRTNLPVQSFLNGRDVLQIGCRSTSDWVVGYSRNTSAAVDSFAKSIGVTHSELATTLTITSARWFDSTRKRYSAATAPTSSCAHSSAGNQGLSVPPRNVSAQTPCVVRIGDLRLLDRAMAGSVDTFRFWNKTLRFDCAYCDEVIQDGSYAFGIVRDMLIRDCYFRYLPKDTLSNLDAVVDLGANRGMFSTLAASSARHVLSVEAHPPLGDDVAHDHVDLSELLDRHSFDTVDLMKIDIERSEFALFEHPGWLHRVKQVCMEVHNKCGDVQRILSCVQSHGFSIILSDSDLLRVGAEDNFEFIYAWR